MSADVAAEDGYYAVIPEWVIDADVSAQAIRLYAVLRRYADKGTLLAHPTRAKLAERLKVKDEKVVDRAVKELAKIGALAVIPRWRDSEGQIAYARDDRHAFQTSNAYRLLRGAGAAIPSEPPLGGAGAPRGGGAGATPRGAEKGDNQESVEPQPVEPQIPQAPAATAAPSEESQSASVIDLRDGDRRRRGPQTIDTTANRSDVQAICDHLADAVGRYARRRPEVTHSWRDAARKLIDVDKADPAEIHAVIEWATADRMWRSNIINAVKLRQHYDTLWIKAKQAAEEARQPVRQNGRPTPIQSAMAIDDLGQRMAEEDARRAALAGNDQFEVTA